MFFFSSLTILFISLILFLISVKQLYKQENSFFIVYATKNRQIYLLILVFLYLVVKELQFDACLTKHFFAFGTLVIFTFAYHSFYTAIYYKHCTSAARSHSAIQGSAFQRYSSSCCLADGILFGMNSAYAMV